MQDDEPDTRTPSEGGVPTASVLWPGAQAQRAGLLLTIAVAALITSLVPLAAVVSGGSIEAAELLADPAELTGAPWYLGALGTVNVMVWAAAAALHLTAAAALRRRVPRLSLAMALLGALALVFAADDAFLLHEVLIPWVLGVGETVTFAAYGAATAVVLLRHRATLLRQPEAPMLLLAVGALGGSVLLDVVGGEAMARRLIEEGLKLLGTLAWAAFPGQVLVRWAGRQSAGSSPVPDR